MDGKWGIVMCKFKVGWIREGIMMWKSKGGCKKGQYDVRLKRADG